MLPISAGVEPATSWSSVGRRIQLSHRGRQMLNIEYDKCSKISSTFSPYFFGLIFYFYAVVS